MMYLGKFCNINRICINITPYILNMFINYLLLTIKTKINDKNIVTLVKMN